MLELLQAPLHVFGSVFTVRPRLTRSIPIDSTLCESFLEHADSPVVYVRLAN